MPIAPASVYPFVGERGNRSTALPWDPVCRGVRRKVRWTMSPLTVHVLGVSIALTLNLVATIWYAVVSWHSIAGSGR